MPNENKREHLPHRRTCEVISVENGKWTGPMQVGLYPDGRMGEVFFTMGHSGTNMREVLNIVAKLVSYALQHGVHPHKLASCLTADFVSSEDGSVMAAPILALKNRLLEEPPENSRPNVPLFSVEELQNQLDMLNANG